MPARAGPRESLARRLTGGHRDALAREVLGRVAAEVHREGGDVLRGRHALERRPVDEGPAHVLERHPPYLGLAGDDPVDPVTRHRAGRDGVDPDVVRGQLERETVGHADLSRLRRAVADAEGEPASARGGGDVHDDPASRLEHLRYREADALAGAGDERHLAIELSHASSLPARSVSGRARMSHRRSSGKAVILTPPGVYLFPPAPGFGRLADLAACVDGKLRVAAARASWHAGCQYPQAGGAP